MLFCQGGDRGEDLRRPRAARLTAGVDARLRQLALIRRQRINRLLDDRLDAVLCPAADLTAQLAVLGQTCDPRERAPPRQAYA